MPIELLEIETSLPFRDDELACLREEQRSFYRALPEMLPVEEIWEANRRAKVAGGRYIYQGIELDLPPGVLVPGGTSEVIFDWLGSSGRCRGAAVTIMGCGAGVEAILAEKGGAARIDALDIHPESVAAARGAFERYCTAIDPERHKFAVSDLFEVLPSGSKSDLIAFNPPANPLRSEDADFRRINFSGSEIMCRFFDQIAERELLAPGGSVITVLSNGNNLRGIAAHALRQGFDGEIVTVKTWNAPYEKILTHLLEFRR